jgi:serine/threonine protein kinase
MHQEVKILRKVRHPNIIRYYTSFYDNSNLYIIMEYAENGDLHKVFSQFIFSIIANKNLKRKEETFLRKINMTLCLRYLLGCCISSQT